MRGRLVRAPWAAASAVLLTGSLAAPGPAVAAWSWNGATATGGHRSPDAGADTTGPSGSTRQSSGTARWAGNHRAAADACRPGRLPRSSSAPQRPGDARELARCLPAAPARNPSGAPGRLALQARTMTVTGLWCPGPAGRECRASSVTLESPRMRYGEGAGVCTTARRVTAHGRVRLSADQVTGHVFGLLPLTFATRTVPPVPLPYVRLTRVTAHGVTLNATEVHGTDATMGAGSACGAPPGAPGAV